MVKNKTQFQGVLKRKRYFRVLGVKFFIVPVAMVFVLGLVFMRQRPRTVPPSQNFSFNSSQGLKLRDEVRKRDFWFLTASPAQAQTYDLTIKHGEVQAGETMSNLLRPYLSIGEILSLARETDPVFPVKRIAAGSPYRLYLSRKQLVGLEFEVSNEDKLVISLLKVKPLVKTEKIHYALRESLVSGVIKDNLFLAMTEQGERPVLAMMLADIFAWDIDFIRDVRIGDSFKVLVQKRFRKGRFCGYGRILAAEFVNQGSLFQAFWYKGQNGQGDYFDAQGLALRKTFLKAPLHFTRISSRYSLHRYHPILKIVRPHRGVDYAAPRGTPIKSVADGKVIAKAYSRAAGRYVKIRHPNGYVTIYNHMSRFSKGLKKNKFVRQGEVIGYVGATGLATGPHLDFRVKHHGRFINPLKIKSSPVKPIPKAELARFKAQIKPLQIALAKDQQILAEK